MRPRTGLRLALAGNGTDRLRVVLTAGTAGLAYLVVLAAVALITLGGAPREALDKPAIWSPVTYVLAILSAPVVALCVQCTLVGGPARERRLAALRMAGATPRQVALIAAAETTIASAVGATLAFGGYVAVRQLVADRDLPDHAVLPYGLAAGVLFGLVATLGLLSVLRLRRVVVSPFGVVRQAWARPLTPWPIVSTLALVGVFTAVIRWNLLPTQLVPDANPQWDSVVITVLLFGQVSAVWLSVGWISSVTGRLLYRWGRRPATLIAARRLSTDPWSGGRLYGTILVTLFIGGFLVGVLQSAVLTDKIVREVFHSPPPGYPTMAETPGEASTRATAVTGGVVLTLALLIAILALLVALADRIVSRRRAYAALVATGVPRSVLARVSLIQTLAPAVPSFLFAVLTGLGLHRATLGHFTYRPVIGECLYWGTDGSCMQNADVLITGVRSVAPWPWEDPATTLNLGLLIGGSLVLLAAVVGLSLTVLRPSTDIGELRVAA